MMLNGRYTYGCVLVHTEYKVMVGILILHMSVPIPLQQSWSQVHQGDICDVRACMRYV